MRELEGQREELVGEGKQVDEELKTAQEEYLRVSQGDTSGAELEEILNKM